MNKSLGDDMKCKGLLTKGSNEHRYRSTKRRGKPDNCGRSRSKSRTKIVECYYCKKGHLKKNCFKFKADQKEEKKPKSTSTTGVVTENKAKLVSLSLGKPIFDV